jgi:hypothetical protein
MNRIFMDYKRELYSKIDNFSDFQQLFSNNDGLQVLNVWPES